MQAPIGRQVAAGAFELLREFSKDKPVIEALDPSPHPAYDDIPDLRLWFDNAII